MAALPLLLIGILPSFVWILFFIREDEASPEPKRLLFYAFLAGAAATFFTLGPQIVMNNILQSVGVPQYSFFTLFIFAGLEEFFKFLAVYAVIAWRKDFDEPLDAMIYMIVAALGFAAVENIASIVQGGAAILAHADAIQVLSLRFIGATLLHGLSSALVGYYWGMAMAKHISYNVMILEGMGVATLLHAIFNTFILVYSPEAMVGTLFLVVASFFILNDFEKLKIAEQQA